MFVYLYFYVGHSFLLLAKVILIWLLQIILPKKQSNNFFKYICEQPGINECFVQGL
jgi:hypothetical protein